MIKRNLDTAESRDFWEHVDRSAAEVDTWPCWKKGAPCAGFYCACGGECHPDLAIRERIRIVKLIDYHSIDANVNQRAVLNRLRDSLISDGVR
jgi:hypothetical protein